MKYIKSAKYNTKQINDRIMGPNPIKLEEELLRGSSIGSGDTVLDLGSGQGATSLFLAEEYGAQVFAADLWSDPTDNMRFFESMGLDRRRIIPIKADANELPFAREFFDAVVCTDSYNYFGRDKEYLDAKLMPFVRRGGHVYIAVPGMVRDCHDALPEELLLSWTPEQLDYIHDAEYWRKMAACSETAEIVRVREMESNGEVWDDWLKCDNEYARGDRRAREAGAGKYLNFIEIVLKKK